MNNKIDEAVKIPKKWQKVADYTEGAKLIAWDMSHKIYLAMDEKEAEAFRTHEGYHTVEGTATEMFKTLKVWYRDSGWLRFINAVESDDKYTTLIRQQV
jgi:hypothetical protein